jgi:KRAB domain-containing zinc finger protein
LESIKFFKGKDASSKIISVSVDDFTDFYKLENQTVRFKPKKVERYSEDIFDIESDEEDDEKTLSEESLIDEIDVGSETQEAIEMESEEETSSEEIQNEFQDQNSSEEIENDELAKYNPDNPEYNPDNFKHQANDDNKASESNNESVETENISKRTRLRNRRYDESEYMLKNSSREFTNAIRGKVGKVTKETGLDDTQDSIKSDKPSVNPEPEKPEAEKAKVDERRQFRSRIKSKVMAAKYAKNPKCTKANNLKRKALKSQKLFCKICNKTFSKAFSLTRHMFLHSGHRPHVCYICDYKFIQRSDLERHLTVHEEEPQFECNLCDSKFRTKKSLRNHVILHDDATPFHCPCGKKFRSNKTLRIHHMITHSDVTYECDICARLYTLKDYLKSHMKSHRLGGNNFVARDAKEKRLHCNEKMRRMSYLMSRQQQ